MPELLMDAPPESAGLGAAERIAREIALLGGRLANLLSAGVPARDATLADGIAFLRAMCPEDVGMPFENRQEADDPIDRLAARLGLAPVELDVVLLAGMPEEHEGYASVLRALHPRGEPRPTIALALQLFCRTPHERLLLREILEVGPAVGSGVLGVMGDAPFVERNLEIAPSLWPALRGLDLWPQGVRSVTTPVSLAGLTEWLATRPVAQACAALLEDEPRLILVVADTEDAAAYRGAAMAQLAGVRAVRLTLPDGGKADIRRLVGLHALARDVIPIVQLAAAEGPVPEAVDFREYPGPVVLCLKPGAATGRSERPVLLAEAGRLPAAACRRMWRDSLPEFAGAEHLAANHALEPTTVAALASDLRSLRRLRAGMEMEDIASAIRTRSGSALAAGATLRRPRASWDQLVLPADRLAQLREALDRLRHQERVLDEWGFLADRPGARGVRMLMAGPPGTGKSLAAEVLAHEIGGGVDLLVVDLARLVSKWIGETEKNLAEVFEAAERSRAVLLFDEADALFGKRTEVADAHDRYANLETAYLLSRLERFEGLAILSTNLRENIDPAFTRRLEFIVEFDEPSQAEREQLWRRHIPDGAPLAPDVRLADLAALYPVVGGLIRNASVAAGFLATSDGVPIAQHHFVRAMRREYEKSGKPFPGAPSGMHTA